MKKISIIIPTYNEKGNIVKLIEQIQSILKNTKFYYEIIIVDDNSSDLTGVIAEKQFIKERNIKVYIRNKRGLATAIYYGIQKSSGDYILGMDADFNHQPKYIPKILSKINKFDLVVGSRFIKGGGMENKIRYFLTLFFNMFLKHILSFPTTDNMSGFFAIKNNILEKLPLNEIFQGYGEYHLRLVFYAKKHGLKIAEVPVYYTKRKYGKSKSNLIKMFCNYIIVALKLSLSNDKV